MPFLRHLGTVWGGSWEGLGRVLGEFGEGFGRVLGRSGSPLDAPGPFQRCFWTLLGFAGLSWHLLALPCLSWSFPAFSRLCWPLLGFNACYYCWGRAKLSGAFSGFPLLTRAFAGVPLLSLASLARQWFACCLFFLLLYLASHASTALKRFRSYCCMLPLLSYVFALPVPY